MIPSRLLDNTNLRRIAKRIVEEARTRQVIVFTHNNVFASELEDAADSLGATFIFNSKSVSKLRTAGIVSDGVDFDNMKVGQRADRLKVN